MHILRVINTVNPQHGGPIEALKQVSQALAQAGHITEIATVDMPDEVWVKECPFPVHALGPASGSYRSSPKLIPWLEENASRYDCVIVHGLWQFVSFAVWKAWKKKPFPYFVYTHGSLDPWFKRAYPLKHLKKWSYWLWREYRVMRDANAVLFTCEEEGRLAKQTFQPNAYRSQVVNYGTTDPTGDPEEQRRLFRERFPELDSKRLLLFLGRITEKKGCDLLIEALAQIGETEPALHLVMAGPDQGQIQDQLEAQARQRGVSGRITWTGMVTGPLKWGAFRAADVFMLPSHSENFGVGVAEALACGLPVLISDKVNIWREIAADDAGLVAEDTAEGTTRLIRDWLALSPARQEAMRENARSCFERRFEIHRVAQSLLDTLAANGVPEQRRKKVEGGKK